MDGGVLAREVATKTISWVLFMREPLRPGALLEALASGNDTTLDLAQVMATCSNFVMLDTKCNVIRFAHQSVQDFLGRHPAFAASKAHCLLAACCIEACSRGPSTMLDWSVEIPKDDFYVYAAMYWPIHTEMSQSLCDDTAEAKNLVRVVTSFMFEEDWDLTLSFESWVSNGRFLGQLLPRDHLMKPALDAIPETDFSFLFVLSIFGLDKILVLAMTKVDDLDVNQPNELGHTSVYLAAAFGHSSTVGILADWGAKINVECGRYGSPLHVACFRGHLEVTRKLLHLGARVVCGSVFKNALQAAFRGGNEDIALHLIDLDQNIETEDDYEEALGQAALLGFVRVVQNLQASRFSSSTRGNPERLKEKTRKAIQGGQVGVLRQFLGRDATHLDHLPAAAVALATLHNHRSMVAFLLDQGKDLEAPGDFGSPLRTASLLNFRSLVQFLLSKGAQIDAFGPLGDALQAAALNGHVSIVRLLIQEGANINQRSGYYGSALQAAAYHGHLDTVELLIDSNADVNADGYCRSAIHAAAEGGHEDVIMLILRKKQLSLPLLERFKSRCSAKRASSSPYKALLENASPGLSRVDFRDPEASQIQVGANPDPKTTEPISDMETVFHLAQGGTAGRQSSTEHHSTFGFTNDRWKKESPLEAAASFGHEDTVSFLLRQEQTALAASYNKIVRAVLVASRKDHSSVVQILLQFVANRPTANHDEAVLRSDRDDEPGLHSFRCGVDAAFRLASEYCTPEECAALSRKCPPKASKSASKYYQTVVREEQTLLDFAISCKTGNVQLAASILETEHHKLLTLRAVFDGIQLCVLHGQTMVAQLLLKSPVLRELLPASGKEAFVNAATNGLLDSMMLFASYWTELPSSCEAMGRALVMASKNGHIAAVRYLVLELGADVNTPSLDICYVPHLTSCELWYHINRCSLPPDHLRKSVNNPEESQAAAALLPVISPLQASLQGLADTISNPKRGLFLGEGIKLRKASQVQQEEVICFLLQKGARPNDSGGQETVPIQVASKYLPLHIVQLLISAGADVNAMSCANPSSESRARRCVSNSALFEAAGRELSGLAISRLLVASGAALPEDAEEQNRLLGQALRYFEGNTSRTKFRTHSFYGWGNHPDGRFRYASSLNEVFIDGPGSVLFYLMSHMPQAKATDRRWALVLQMAAFLNEEGFIDLLLSRGIDVNTTGYYYGTALQAAACCGHTVLTQKLLDAGAEVNLTGGVWHTALRAALVNGHDTTIYRLLDHGADVKLWPPRSWERGSLTNEGKNALQLAIRTGDINIVKAVLVKRSDGALETPEEDQIPLVIAESEGADELEEVLRKAGVPVTVPGRRRFQHSSRVAEDASPIHAAAAAGHLDALNHLPCSVADIDNNSDGSGTPLAVAASIGNIRLVRHLITAGARTDNSMALEMAVQNDHVEIVRLLLASGARAKDAISAACRRGNLVVVELLVEEALDNDEPEAVFNDAFSAQGLEETVTRLLLQYATPTMPQFHRACATASLASVEILLREGRFDINHADEHSGDYPLQVAALHIRADVVRTLLSHGADLECSSPNHGTPLNTVLKACAAPILRAMEGENIRRIVNKLSLPTPQGNLGPMPNWRQSRDCIEIVEQLIAHGANTGQVDPLLGPPLHLAFLLGFPALIELLLSKEQILDSIGGHFGRPLFAAVQGRNSRITELLLQHSPRLDYVHAEYGTALHHACTVRDASTTKTLLQHGADATIRDVRGQTPLTVALQKELEVQKSTAPADLWQTEWQSQMSESTPLKVILQLAKSLHISDEDLTVAAELSRDYGDKANVLGRLLSVESSRVTPRHPPAI